MILNLDFDNPYIDYRALLPLPLFMKSEVCNLFDLCFSHFCSLSLTIIPFDFHSSLPPNICQSFFLHFQLSIFLLKPLSYELLLSGDMAASQVTALTEEVTAIVMNARPERGDKVSKQYL